MGERIPVILDTDIGTDVDDTWALAMLLASPVLDLKLVLTTHADTTYRARVAARFLEYVGRSEVAVGVGLAGAPLPIHHQEGFVRDYALDRYPGPVFEDGVGALLEAVEQCDAMPTIISIGPLTNLAAALARDPSLAQKARFVGMQGSVRLGYKGSPEVAAEYNVACDIEACRRVFAAPWSVTLTPLDTCGIVYLKDALYQRVASAPGPRMAAVRENYKIWLEAVGAPAERLGKKSTTLYDTVAVYLAEAEDLLEIEALGIRVDDQGFTRIDEAARPLRVATAWKDLSAFRELLVERLCG